MSFTKSILKSDETWVQVIESLVQNTNEVE